MRKTGARCLAAVIFGIHVRLIRLGFQIFSLLFVLGRFGFSAFCFLKIDVVFVKPKTSRVLRAW